ncbi:MAG: hypothetical protein H6815_06635 [Phycisphaeraceae bacterium]|nr:hypothetical protein [Phycisphaerales bacterium]MCB9860115.1 hypothetical protein [Phycisphaeraceae bacterium]
MPTTFTTARRLSCVAMLCAGAAVPMTGCVYSGYREGGNMISNDRHVYVSRAWEPKTVSLVDSRTGETVWTYEVPVGQKLVVQFFKGKKDAAPQFPDIMRWGVFDDDATGGSLSNTIAVPGQDARRLEWVMRAAPEYPSIG